MKDCASCLGKGFYVWMCPGCGTHRRLTVAVAEAYEAKAGSYLRHEQRQRYLDETWPERRFRADKEP